MFFWKNFRNQDTNNHNFNTIMRKLFTLAALALVTAASALAQEEQYNQYGVKVNIDPLQAEAQDGILVLRSKSDSGYKIWLDNPTIVEIINVP